MFRAILLAVSAALPFYASAQSSEPAPQVVPPSVLTAKTPVLLVFADEVSSKSAVKDAEVRFRLAEDLHVGEIVVPKGTPAFGEVVHVQKAGLGGRGGELILAARHLDYRGQRIPLRSLKPLAAPYAGKNRSDAALAASFIPYAGLMSMFITGGQVVIPAGTEALASVAADTPVSAAPETQ